MKLTVEEGANIRNFTVADFEKKYPELSEFAHKWGDFLVSHHGMSFFSEEFLNLESQFKPGPVCCRFLTDGFVFVEKEFAYSLYNEWLLNGKEFKDFVSYTNSLKYETPALRLAEPDFYTIEEKMEAEDEMKYGFYGRKRKRNKD